MVAVNDLGAGGVFFNSSNNLEVGTILDLKIGFSTYTPSIKCDGVVIRVTKQPNTSIFGIATAFSKIDEHVREMINKVAEVNYKINKLNFSDIAATLSLAS
jgi:Tfp pilus assembly ATPase PilU